MRAIDMTGQICGFLKVIERSGKRMGKEKMWLCECLLCGNLTYSRGTDLRAGRKRSCGCLVKESFHKIPESVAIFEPATDCVMYRGEECYALREMLCVTTGKCSFYKAKDENSAEIQGEV